MTELTLKHDTSLPSEKGELFRIALWTLVLILLPSIIIGFCMGVYFGALSSPGLPLEGQSFEDWIAQPDKVMTMMIGASLVTLPIVKWATIATSWRHALRSYRFTNLESEKLVWTVAFVSCLLAILYFINFLFEPGQEPFVLKLQQGMTSTSNIALTFVAICICAPIIEEIVYRGWLYGRLEKTRIGRGYGALIITTIIFTVIHLQYETWLGYLSIVLVGLLFGLLRMRYQSISYSIVAHFLFNSFSMAMILS